MTEQTYDPIPDVGPIYRAHVETRHFSFEAFGYTEAQARAALGRGMIDHARQLGADADYLADLVASAEVRHFTPGVAYRDGEAVLPPVPLGQDGGAAADYEVGYDTNTGGNCMAGVWYAERHYYVLGPVHDANTLDGLCDVHGFFAFWVSLDAEGRIHDEADCGAWGDEYASEYSTLAACLDAIAQHKAANPVPADGARLSA